jgi:DNA-binding beta-propeller fold protein YncE
VQLAAVLVSTFVLVLIGAAGSAARTSGGWTVALVTSELQNELLAVDLPEGNVVRRVRVPAGPESVEATATGPVVVVSSRAGVVSIYAWHTLRLVKRIGGFREPHIAALSPVARPGIRGGPARAYVTDDAAGTLSTIDLRSAKVIGRVYVGPEAHHMAVSPDDLRIWVALGEKARTIAVLDNSRIGRPRVIKRFDPGFQAHDVAFSPDGRRVWVTSSEDSRARVFDARSGRLAFTVEAGAPPQHVTFNTGHAFVTSGYGNRLTKVGPAGRILRAVDIPHGSFNVTSAGGLVVTSSLLRGTLTEFGDRLGRPMMSVKVAPAARDAAVVVWP